MGSSLVDKLLAFARSQVRPLLLNRLILLHNLEFTAKKYCQLFILRTIDHPQQTTNSEINFQNCWQFYSVNYNVMK